DRRDGVLQGPVKRGGTGGRELALVCGLAGGARRPRQARRSPVLKLVLPLGLARRQRFRSQGTGMVDLPTDRRRCRDARASWTPEAAATHGAGRREADDRVVMAAVLGAAVDRARIAVVARAGRARGWPRSGRRARRGGRRARRF